MFAGFCKKYFSLSLIKHTSRQKMAALTEIKRPFTEKKPATA